MSDSGNNGGMKKDRFSRLAKMVESNAFKETVGYTTAEFASMATSLGVVGIADQVAPGLIGKIGKDISSYPASQKALDFVDKNILQRFCKLEECRPDPHETAEQRREFLARTMVVFSAAWALSLAAKVATRRGLNQLNGLGDGEAWWKVWRANKHDRKVVYWDEGVHYGSLLLFNTGLAKYTDSAIRTTSKMLQKTTGMSEKKAHELASMAMIWEAPNVLGLVAGLWPISKQHNHDWGFNKSQSHVDRLDNPPGGGLSGPQK